MTVWARFGTFGWRPAVITSLCTIDGRFGAFLEFKSGSRGRGKRLLTALRHRDPAKGGADKPCRADAVASAMEEAR